MVILLISPCLDKCGSAVGDSLKDCVGSFHSGKWRQGYNADGRVLEEYGNWAVYQCDENSRHELKYVGQFKDLLTNICPERLPSSLQNK